ncbi:ABC transporter ATP-binding protein [Eisenibacter elegans]|jgi:ATP-binding cassette subfamily B protein|uniref:ABC transporter ATP-binding protein n=1 Tax=Eisenibacter elegans TaxID=997 RepID=UPI00040CBDAD|nr:ABC transporter ATP-binding protein [Eisenibacter elegans]
MLDKETRSDKKILDWKTLKRLWVFVKAYIGYFYLLTFLTITIAFLGPLRPFLVQYTIDTYVFAGDYDGLWRMTLLMFGLLFAQTGLQYYHTWLSGWLGQTIVKDIRIALYEHILSLKLKFYDNTPIGRLVTRVVSDIETLSNVFTEGISAMLADILQIFFILALMFYIDWQLTLISLSMLPLMLLSTYIFKERIKVAFDEVRAAVSNLNSFVQEHITGMNIVQIFNAEAVEQKKFAEINREHRRSNLKSVLYYSVYFPVAEVISAGGTGLLVWYGARGVLHETVTLGTLIAFIMYIALFFRPIRMIADRFNTLQLGVVSTDRILKLLDSTEHIANNGNYIPEKLQGDIQFKDVWFAYEGENYVLKNINFEVAQGQTVALVGATGSGKSTIINLLSRFYELSKGDIIIDEVSVKDYELTQLRRKIGVVLQDVFLFSDSIHNNITLGNPDISREQVIEAAKLVGADKFIERLPDGYDYNVMERGATLSVGQRQLISFVRAMVYNPTVIVLDEATSSVDTETEEMIQEAIEKIMKGRTAIVIAHRLSTIQKAHKILVLDKGEIKESGTHEALLAQGGYYTQLHAMQYKEVV